MCLLQSKHMHGIYYSNLLSCMMCASSWVSTKQQHPHTYTHIRMYTHICMSIEMRHTTVLNLLWLGSVYTVDTHTKGRLHTRKQTRE
jgi:hypothetical protein